MNVKSSTEVELVGADDDLGQVIFTKHFVEGQLYNVESNTMYQDNRSTMLLKTNGWDSGGREPNIPRQDIIWLKTQLIWET